MKSTKDCRKEAKSWPTQKRFWCPNCSTRTRKSNCLKRNIIDRRAQWTLTNFTTKILTKCRESSKRRNWRLWRVKTKHKTNNSKGPWKRSSNLSSNARSYKSNSFGPRMKWTLCNQLRRHFWSREGFPSCRKKTSNSRASSWCSNTTWTWRTKWTLSSKSWRKCMQSSKTKWSTRKW